jgi:predicted dehydrogenase
MGRLHAEALQRVAPGSVAAFVARHPSQEALELAHALDAAILPSVAAALTRQDLDTLVVATPTDTHAEIVIGAAQAGKQVICEKPLARTLDDGERMLEATSRAGVKLAVAQVVRYFPEYAAARDMVLRGELGTPGVARVTRVSSFPAVAGDWYTDFGRSGGVTLDMMIHDFDWLRWTFGPVERIYARGLARSGVARKDATMAVLRFRSGALGYAEGSWCYPGGFRTTFEISGSDGLVRAASRATAPLSFELFPDGGNGPGVSVPSGGLNEDPYVLQMRDFVRWFAGGAAPRCSGEDAFEALRVALAALDSVTSERPVVP